MASEDISLCMHVHTDTESSIFRQWSLHNPGCHNAHVNAGSYFDLLYMYITVGIPTTVRKTEVRTTPVRSQECECQQCEETTVRMRQKCEGQVCEGQECECDFSAIGQNSELIQIERSRSFCLQDGVFFFSLSLSVSLFLSRVIR